DNHRRRLKECGDCLAHPGQEHVVCPNDKGHEAEEDNGVHHHAIAEERLPCIIRDDLTDDSKRREDQHVNLTVCEKPKEVLPEHGTSSARNFERFTAYYEPARKEEARSGDAVHK